MVSKWVKSDKYADCELVYRFAFLERQIEYPINLSVVIAKKEQNKLIDKGKT